MIGVEIIADLSRGKFTEAQVEMMELIVCYGLEWRLNPPTTLSFARSFLELIPNTLLDDTIAKEEIYDLARLQLELLVADYNFVTTRSSTLAFCCIYNCMKSQPPFDDKASFQKAVDIIASAIPQFDRHSAKVQDLQDNICNSLAHLFLHAADAASDDLDDDIEQIVNRSTEEQNDYSSSRGKYQLHATPHPPSSPSPRNILPKQGMDHKQQEIQDPVSCHDHPSIVLQCIHDLAFAASA